MANLKRVDSNVAKVGRFLEQIAGGGLRHSEFIGTDGLRGRLLGFLAHRKAVCAFANVHIAMREAVCRITGMYWPFSGSPEFRTQVNRIALPVSERPGATITPNAGP